ncbi:MOSC domain-containing protein [Marinicaulis aureus]|uniref:MOSC domain-containing protein n=1 Tax=Hyphococcus aureus TaxID=2666033 RepID=A0ABW1L141_9PROT
MSKVVAVSLLSRHRLSKDNALCIRLLKGLGVEGDAHCGETVKHRSRVRKDPAAPNLRQVHLIHAELFDELAARGFSVGSGQMGENITTQGIDLLAMPVGTKLCIGEDAMLELTGLRNPCSQLDGLHKGLMAATLDRDGEGGLIRKAGVMAIVLNSGDARPGDVIEVEFPPHPHKALAPV